MTSAFSVTSEAKYKQYFFQNDVQTVMQPTVKSSVRTRFSYFSDFPNAEPDLWSGSAPPPNLEPNFGPVLTSSGSNFGSEPDCGIASHKHI
jgi:hypothetical protein